jgi:RNA polymerase sigma-70 factor (ECF subfamily)
MFAKPLILAQEVAVGSRGLTTERAAVAPETLTDALFREVATTCTRLITRIVMSYEADPALQRELIQDTFLAIWVALPKFRRESSLKTFVVAIARRRCISHVARRAREPRQVQLSCDLRSTSPAPDELALRKQEERQLRSALQRLPIGQREAILLCFEGFSYAEVAAILGITANAAMIRCQRAKRALQALVAPAGKRWRIETRVFEAA